MGFGSRYIRWIKACISNVHFSVLINGAPSTDSQMFRGLRQGDPLSPFLFILVSEVLSRMLHNALSQGLLQGFKIHNHLSINHSQFADDTILFLHPSRHEAIMIKEILHIFQEVSGLKINFDKSALYGKHLPSFFLEQLASILECQVGSQVLKYLGIPIGASPHKSKIWDLIISKFKCKTN